MKIKLRTSQNIHTRDVKRLSDSLGNDPNAHEQFQFSVTNPHNCVVYKMAPYTVDATLVVQHVLTAVSVNLYALSVDEDHRGWLFMLPVQGHVFTVSSGIIYVKSDLQQMRHELTKSIRTIENDVKSIEPEVYLPHSDFNILGLRQGDIVFVARNATHVVTQ